MPPWFIRPAQLDDADGIAELHAEAWQVAYENLLTPEQLQMCTKETQPRVWKRLLEPPTKIQTYVARFNRQTIGFIRFGVSSEHDRRELLGEIYVLYVHPGYWGQKVGASLANLAFGLLHEHRVKKVFVWTLASNERGRRFYESLGMTTDGVPVERPLEHTMVQEVQYWLDLKKLS
ncbi:MAG: GNAT family N-acetyltransferase [Candidatus Andersenbacteria bacterium]|nr:GNAT family N-acetyltransferase [Candidatus Andersenbacteria bacterium]MBI3251064.1 GNAT family N-acetyltransferase [Candidatus Andersenbacteria bacterium]